MGIVTGLVGTLFGELASLLSSLFGTLFGQLTAIVGALLSFLWSQIAVVVGLLLSLLWGVLVFAGLFGAAILLRVLGVDDVYGTLFRRLDDEDGTDDEQVIPDISHEEVTDEAGRFSGSAFTTATGMTPEEFVHLFVKSNGGRVRQSTLNTCLPWSKSTVSRHLDSLEKDGELRRVQIGRQNVVCTPEEVPDVDPDASTARATGQSD